MSGRLACMLVVLAVAGCLGDDAAQAGGPTPMSSTSAPTAGPGALAPQPAQVRQVPLEWQGSLVLGAWACEFTVTGSCRWAPDGAFGQSHAFEGLAGNVTGGELRVEWTSTSPLTQELVLDAAAYQPDCGDCNHTMVGSVAGPSPLVLPLPVGLRFMPGMVLGIGVYSNQYRSTDQAAAGTSGDQEFRVVGNVTLLA